VKNGKQVLQEVLQIKFGKLNIFINKNHMVQPKYSPEEALHRIKLMMEYDSSKTLTENKKVIEEQTAGNPASQRTLGYGLAGAAGGASAAGGGLAAAMTAGATAGSVFPVVGTAIGAVAGIGLGMLIDWWSNKDYGEEGFKQVMSACSSKGASKLVPQLSKADVRNIAYSIEDAKGQWNDDEDAIKSALERIPTVGDLCAVDKKISGGLYQFLNDLTDSPDEWKMFTRPLEGMIEDTEFVADAEDAKKVETGGYPGKSGGGGTNQQSPKIPSELKDIEGVKKFQDWLDKNKAGWATGFPDGKLNKAGGYGRFGPRTTKAWSSYGQEYMKGGSVQPDVTPEVSGEVQNVNVSNADF